MNGENMETTKAKIIAALYKLAGSRPGLEYANYDDPVAYRSESRTITRDLHDARTLLRACELSSLGEDCLLAGFRAYSGRLSCKLQGGTVRLDYCTGQYYPTEYRRAVCAVAASALWDHYRDDIPKDAERPGDLIRAKFARMFGGRIARRWFN